MTTEFNPDFNAQQELTSNRLRSTLGTVTKIAIAGAAGLTSLGAGLGMIGESAAGAVGAPIEGPTPLPADFHFDFVASGGLVVAENTPDYGSEPFPTDNSVVGIANQNTTGYQYDTVLANGTVNTHDNTANYYGDASNISLNKPIVGMDTTSDGEGYWEVASDGGIFSYGDAGFYGSMGGAKINKPIVGMAGTPDEKGYYEVASDGGIFAFGDARFYGSTGNIALNSPIVGMAETPDGDGYYEVAADGGVFSFGDAEFLGSVPGEGEHITNASAIVESGVEDSSYGIVDSQGDIYYFEGNGAHGETVSPINFSQGNKVVGAIGFAEPGGA